ncbi:MAG: DMT family transporter [Pseudomonadota bacterium]
MLEERGGRGSVRLFDQPYLLFTLTMLFWAANMVVARASAGHIPPIALAQMRWSLALLILLPIAYRALKADWPVVTKHWKVLAFLGVAGISIYNTLIYVALQSTTAINATMLTSIFPMMIAATGFLLYRDRLTPVQFVAILVACVGAGIILSQGSLSTILGFKFNAGDLWVIGAMVAYAVYTVALRERPANLHPLTFLTVTVFFGQLVLMPMTVWEGWSGAQVAFDATTLGIVVFLAVFPAILAFIFFNRGVELVGSNRAAPFFHLVPVFASVGAIGFLGEKIALYHLVGWPLILLGIASTQIFRKR